MVVIDITCYIPKGRQVQMPRGLAALVGEYHQRIKPSLTFVYSNGNFARSGSSELYLLESEWSHCNQDWCHYHFLSTKMPILSFCHVRSYAFVCSVKFLSLLCTFQILVRLPKYLESVVMSCNWVNSIPLPSEISAISLPIFWHHWSGTCLYCVVTQCKDQFWLLTSMEVKLHGNLSTVDLHFTMWHCPRQRPTSRTYSSITKAKPIRTPLAITGMW